MTNRIAPKLLAEFIGTFAFVFIGAGTAAVVSDGVGLCLDGLDGIDRGDGVGVGDGDRRFCVRHRDVTG